MNILVQVFMWRCLVVFLGYIPRSRFSGSNANSIFNLLRKILSFLCVHKHFYSESFYMHTCKYFPRMYTLKPCQYLLSVNYFILPIGHVGNGCCICLSLLIVKLFIFKSLLAICISSVNWLFTSSLHLKKIHMLLSTDSMSFYHYGC